MNKLGKVAVALAMAFPVGAAFGEGRVICVDGKAAAGGDGSAEAPYQTIAEGVAAAQNGDVVKLAEGIHAMSGVVVVDKELTIEGGLAERTIIRADGTGFTMFRLANEKAVLAGVTLTDAVAAQKAAVDLSAGTLEDAIVCNNQLTGTSKNTGAVYISGASAVVRRCVIRDNVSSGWGGGVFFGANGTVDSCLITGNSAPWGSAIYIDKGVSSPTIVHVTATGNKGSAQQVYNYNNAVAGLKIYDCLFESASELATGRGNMVKSGATVAELKGKGVVPPLEGLSVTDIDGLPYDQPPSIGCRSYCDTAPTLVWDGPSTAMMGDEVTATLRVDNVPEGASVTLALLDSGGELVAASEQPCIDLAFTTTQNIGRYAATASVVNGRHVVRVELAGFLAVLVESLHVATGATPHSPYASADTALGSIEDALKLCAADGTVYVHAGTYELKAQISLANSFSLIGVDGRDRTVLKPASGTSHRLVVLNHPNALVKGFTLRGGRADEGGGVYVNAAGGVVEDCLIENCTSSECGGGVYLKSPAAVIRRTILRNNDAGSSRWGGGAYTTDGGLFDSCLFYGNSANYGGGYYAERGGAAVTLVNCTLANNKSTMTGKDVYDYRGGNKYVNVIVGNIVQAGTSANVMTTSLFNSTPVYKDPDNGDYTPAEMATTVIDCGTEVEGMSGTDVYGRPRKSGEGVDIGAAEKQADVLTVDVRSDFGEALWTNGIEVTLTPFVGGSTTATLDWRIIRMYDLRVVAQRADTAVEPFVFVPETPGVYTVELTANEGSARTASVACTNLFTTGVRDVYVDERGGDAYPFGAADAAARSFADAWPLAVTGATVHVAAGVYETERPLDLSRPIRILGAGRDVSVIRLRDGVNGRVAVLSHAESVIRGCTLAGGRLGRILSEGHGCGVLIGPKGGLLEDCRVTDCRVVSGGEGHCGAGVCFAAKSNGVMRRCVIDGNQSMNCGGGVYVADGCKGIVVDCLIAKNAARWGGGLYTDGVLYLTNATVAANSKSYYAAGFSANVCLYEHADSRLVNLAVDSTGDADDQLLIGAVVGSQTFDRMFSHCNVRKCAYRQESTSYECAFSTNNGNMSNETKFRDRAHGDFRLVKSSPLREAGLYVPWMRETDDLDGRPLGLNHKAPIGAYADPKLGLMLLVK